MVQVALVEQLAKAMAMAPYTPSLLPALKMFSINSRVARTAILRAQTYFITREPSMGRRPKEEALLPAH